MDMIEKHYKRQLTTLKRKHAVPTTIIIIIFQWTHIKSKIFIIIPIPSFKKNLIFSKIFQFKFLFMTKIFLFTDFSCHWIFQISSYFLCNNCNHHGKGHPPPSFVAKYIFEMCWSCGEGSESVKEKKHRKRFYRFQGPECLQESVDKTKGQTTDF